MGPYISYNLTNSVIDSSDTNPVHVVHDLKKQEREAKYKKRKKQKWKCILLVLQWYILLMLIQDIITRSYIHSYKQIYINVLL